MIAAMATAFPNLIDGRSVESTDRTPDINPSNIQDIVGEFARGTPADVEHAVASARQAFAKWSVSNPQERFDILDRAGTEILARKEELGRQLSREQGKPLADGDGRGRPRRRHLQVFRRRGGADPRRQARLGAPGRRGRGHARAGRRRRRSSRRGTFRWRFRRGRSRRRSPSATASSSSRRSSRRRRRGRSSTSSSAPACRPAC